MKELVLDLVRDLIALDFAQPSWWLLSLIVPLLLAVWMCRGRRRRIALPFDHGRNARGWRWGIPLTLASLLPCGLLAIALLLWCRPVISELPTRERELLNVEIVLDVSGSMKSEFGEGTRYDAAMEAIERFTTRRAGDSFGLTIFGNEVMRWTPVTRDLSAIRLATPYLKPSSLPRHFGGTEIGKALTFTLKHLDTESTEGDAMIILLSDGKSYDLGGERAGQIGNQIKAEEVLIYAIHIGDTTVPEELYGLTRPSGGEVFKAEDPATLDLVFKQIDKLKPVTFKPGAKERVDAFRPFAVLGFALLLLYQLALLVARFTPW